MEKTAIITGANGQDGSYLSELLLSKNYNVVGIVRRSSVEKLDNIKHLLGDSRFKVVEGDISDPSSVNGMLRKYYPDEFYNLAAQSHVATSFEQPNYTFNVNTTGVLNILEGIRHISPQTKLYQASTSEMFGDNVSMDYDVQGCSIRYDGPFDKNSYPYKERYGKTYSTPQNDFDGIFQDENTIFNPRSPYGIAKLAAHKLVNIYRDAYNIRACCGILFNHESPRRGVNFVTRKITRWIGNFLVKNECLKFDGEPIEWIAPPGIYDGYLYLGNIDSVRDWGHAEDYVEGMWRMLQQDKFEDFVLATGECHSVKEFLEIAFSKYNLDYKDYVRIDTNLFRPADVVHLNGCADKAKLNLGWKPKKKFSDLVYDMLESDYKYAKTQQSSR